MSIPAAVAAKAQSAVPLELQIRGAHLYDKTRRWVTGTNGKKIFTETPIPPVEDVDIADIDLSNPFLYRRCRWKSYFERVRNEAPVHYQARSPFGPFWSVTRHADIIAVDKNHEAFSAEPFIIIGRPPRFMDIAMFIAMDPPQHDLQRASVQGVVAPKNLREMEGLIRSRVQEVLDDLPVDQPFNWVHHVSIELTARMLATLLDFPYEQRHKLVEWSDSPPPWSKPMAVLPTTTECFVAWSTWRRGSALSGMTRRPVPPTGATGLRSDHDAAGQRGH